MNKIMLLTIIIMLTTVPVLSRVTNTAIPSRGKWDFQAQKLWDIEEAGKDVFGEIQNIQTTDNGKIFIADSKNYAIYIFDKNGKYLSRFGKRGEGPGEIKYYSMGEQLFAVESNIIFTDRGMLHYYDTDGTFKKDVRISTRFKPRTFINPDLFVSAPDSAFRLRGKKGKITLYDIKTGTEQAIAEFSPFKKASATQSRAGRQSTIVMIFGGITPLMNIGQRNGNIYYGMSNTYQIDRVDANGKKKPGFSVEGKSPKPITKAVKKELRKGFGDIPPDMLDKIMNGLPEKASYFSSIRIDKNGLVYVFLSDPVSGPKLEIDIFSPEGKYLYSSVIRIEDDRNITAVHFRDETLILASEDEDGNIHVAKYSIKTPD